ncbi:PepSY-associated TM helix domain-containing protein [Methylobacterium planeticum]|uniref:PepSY domain-containing protein n=1 Tax=Methylobacterium planeticum TaxID=2615211 RepID=A0A6N6ML31_9HYPH|nr:PepSY-associated TM helix domain-containing protein [Methylobacterium planeticum]KAB1070955.1 PepSY domain-containing protein [Methylobacterium planeticum]
MRQGFRQSMAWLHTWSGLVVGWVLFAVFVTGAASYYRAEISEWMRPELQTGAPIDAGRAADLAADYLRAKAPAAQGWFIGLPQPDKPVTELYWWNDLVSPLQHALLDPRTGAPSPARDTQGGDFLYRFHFELNMPPLWGRWIVGLCAMVLLVALVSGIVTHRRIFADFFTFRRRKSLQRGWLDAHNVTGVLALPFHLMIAYTGIVTLAPMYVPWGITAAFKGDETRFFVEAGLSPEVRLPVGKPGSIVSLAPLVATAQARVSEPLEHVAVYNPGDAAATIVTIFEEPKGLAHLHPQIAFDGATGAELGTTGLVRPATRISAAFVGLHEAHFAGPALRALFFLCGLMGAAAIASGLILWSVARLPKAGERPGLGFRLVRALNVGAVAGLPVGLAAYFLANRLLPVGVAGRADLEVRIFFGAWAAIALAALLRPHLRAWREALGLASLLFLAIPVVSALTTGAQAFDGAARFLGFDAAMLATGLLLAFAASEAGRTRPPRRAEPAVPAGRPAQRAAGTPQARSAAPAPARRRA